MAVLQQVDVDSPIICNLIHLHVYVGTKVAHRVRQLVLCTDTAVLQEIILHCRQV